MTDTTSIKYRYKLPSKLNHMVTRSFGIEPYVTRGRDGRQVKAGKSIVRCLVYSYLPKAWDYAKEAADHLVDLLNAGRIYKGPKTISFRIPVDVEGYFDD